MIDEAPPTGRGDVSYEELTRAQQTLVRRMAESKATAPDFSLTLEAEPARAGDAYVIKAVALALRDFPRANGAYRDGQFELYSRVNVGFATPGPDALVFPTVFDADRKSVEEIEREVATLADRARDGTITPPEVSAGTFTVWSLPVRRFTPILNPPQAAILAVGSVEPRAVVRGGSVVAREVMELTLVSDHRILYGDEAAAFVARVRELLEGPANGGH
jgi:pyruvate dehydrogenase E2 component (dihydrolipoamide acetyltransferase)